MKKLYFVRHGLSQLGKQGLWAGSTDTLLADEGRLQATEAGRAAIANGIHIDYIISSPLIRAHDTARLIAAEISYPDTNIEINPLIIERDFGELEGTAWDPEFEVSSIASVESTASILSRAEQTYEYLQTLPYDNILLVSHGSFGRALRHIINPAIPFDTKGRFQNAEIVELI